MKQYKLVDNVLGWLAFLIAAQSLSLQVTNLKSDTHPGHRSSC